MSERPRRQVVREKKGCVTVWFCDGAKVRLGGIGVDSVTEASSSARSSLLKSDRNLSDRFHFKIEGFDRNNCPWRFVLRSNSLSRL